MLRMDRTYHTDIATDVERRIHEHNSENGKGARYTAARRPVRLVYVALFATRSEALKEELRIKGLTRSQKAKLIADVV